MKLLQDMAAALPNARTGVEGNPKSGKFRLAFTTHNHKVVGLWRETLEEAAWAALDKILSHEAMLADLPWLHALQTVVSHHER